MDLEAILKRSVDQDVSDIFIVPGAPVTLKMKGDMTQLSDERVMPADTEEMLRQIYRMAQSRRLFLLAQGSRALPLQCLQAARLSRGRAARGGLWLAGSRTAAYPAAGYRAVQGASGHGAGDGACGQRKVHDAGVLDRPH